MNARTKLCQPATPQRQTVCCCSATACRNKHDTSRTADHFSVTLETTCTLRYRICSVHAIKDAFHSPTAENTLL